MSRQFQFYLLPADVESLLETLRSRLDISLIQPWSLDARPVPLQSAVVRGALELKGEAVRAHCYIVASSAADIRMKYVVGQSRWLVHEETSEVIQFFGCEFDGRVLVRGRFYLQTDFLVGDAIVPKRADFLQWADKVFRLTKKLLRRSKGLHAYVGEHADKWRRGGGKFASMATPGRGPIFERDALDPT